MSKASRSLADLPEAVTARAVLDSLKLKLDGTGAAAETVRRKRRTLVNAANYAVDLGELRENGGHRRTRGRRLVGLVYSGPGHEARPASITRSEAPLMRITRVMPKVDHD
ncbi:hypothetical protein ACIPSH_17945 [Streptomyces iakyrus]|uniref:hypothetical protein n=1 Tax=Streptomyces iakyrus TaxID=68219 RepID=UPI00380239E2